MQNKESEANKCSNKFNNIINAIMISIGFALMLILILIIGLRIICNIRFSNKKQKLDNNFSKVKKISEKSCYHRNGCFLGLGNLSHDYCYRKAIGCKKIEYRAEKNGNYYTYFVIDRVIEKSILESFSSQEKYFPIVNKVITELGLSKKVKDIFISGVPDYSEKGNEFKLDYGNASSIIIYIDENFTDVINQDIFNKYMDIISYVDESDSYIYDFKVRYKDYALRIDYSLGLMLYKENDLILDESDSTYEITNYNDLIDRLHR